MTTPNQVVIRIVCDDLTPAALRALREFLERQISAGNGEPSTPLLLREREALTKQLAKLDTYPAR